jgi:DNA-binding MarR family transcriptional regulator
LPGSAEWHLRKHRFGGCAHRLNERFADGVAARGQDRSRGDDVDADAVRAEFLGEAELANALGVTQRRVTALVDALEEDGFVERRPHPTDGRSTVVSLTTAGQAQQDINWQQQQTEIGLAFGDLSVEHQEQLLAITPTLTEALRKRASERDGGN